MKSYYINKADDYQKEKPPVYTNERLNIFKAVDYMVYLNPTYKSAAYMFRSSSSILTVPR